MPTHIGERPGDWIGPYKLHERIGEGGFGTVWLSERREPMIQRVALKIIKPGMDSKAVIARFEQERQALAVMDHPNVAKVFDGGVTPTGRPYFVMEYVHGEAITTYCDRHNLTIEDRLKLFMLACDGIQHAHMKGIIHRDVKPSNILVTVKDGKPAVKVIDFGVAKAVSHTLTEKTIFTETGHLVGTPEYMSPEQAEMGALDVDTRTDVYSLGVVLYELLAGTLPFDATTLRQAGYGEIQRIIREVDPPKPSTKLRSMGAASADVATRRQVHASSLYAVLHRELEWIPLKAMRKDRTDRYPTATDLASDVQRFLTARPLVAVPESRTYLLSKWARRHRRWLAAASSVVFSLIAGMAAFAWQWQQTRSAETRAFNSATVAAARFELLRDLANDVLSKLDPLLEDIPGTFAVRRQLASTSLRYLEAVASTATKDEQQLALELSDGFVRVGKIMGGPNGPNLGDYPGAVEQFKRALALLDLESPGPEVLTRRVIVLQNLGDALIAADRVPEAMRAYGTMRTVATKRLNDFPNDRDAIRNLAIAISRVADLTDNGQLKEQLYRESLSLYLRLADGNQIPLAEVHGIIELQGKLADCHATRSNWEGAIEELQRASANVHEYLLNDPISRRAHHDAIVVAVKLAQAYRKLGDEHQARMAYCNAANSATRYVELASDEVGQFPEIIDVLFHAALTNMQYSVKFLADVAETRAQLVISEQWLQSALTIGMRLKHENRLASSLEKEVMEMENLLRACVMLREAPDDELIKLRSAPTSIPDPSQK